MKHAIRPHPFRRHRRRHERHCRGAVQPGLPHLGLDLSRRPRCHPCCRGAKPGIWTTWAARAHRRADAVVTSTAVKADNPRCWPPREKIPVVPRALMLAELMRLKRACHCRHATARPPPPAWWPACWPKGAGSHLRHRRASLNSAGANAKLGSGDYIVVEADESDASFLNLLPVMASSPTSTPTTWRPTATTLRGSKGFVDFLHRMPFYGTAILCIDNPAARDRARGVPPHHQLRLFGTQVRAVNVRAVGAQMHFTVQRRNGVTLPDLEVVLNLAGEHNVLNALSAIAVAVELNIPDEAVLRALASSRASGGAFRGYGDLPAKLAAGASP